MYNTALSMPFPGTIESQDFSPIVDAYDQQLYVICHSRIRETPLCNATAEN